MEGTLVSQVTASTTLEHAQVQGLTSRRLSLGRCILTVLNGNVELISKKKAVTCVIRVYLSLLLKDFSALAVKRISKTILKVEG